MTMEGNGAELLVQALSAAGVQHIFGVPGDTGVIFYDVLRRSHAGIRHVLARDERLAAAMADGYARATHRLGVVEASSGGGATFLVSGLGEAYAASVPLLVITSDIHRRSRGTSAITEIDQVKLFSAVTKAQRVVESANQMVEAVQEAVVLAWSGRPGPVSLIIPEDVFEEMGRAGISGLRPDVPRPRPSDHDLEKVASLLHHAYQPAIVLGSGVHWSKAWEELGQVSDRGGIPVATTIHGKGGFPERHPLSLGVAGANGARDYANAYLHEADVVLFVGTRANSTDTDGFQSPPREGTRVIHLDIDATRAGVNYSGSLVLVGDAKEVLSRLLAFMPEGRRERSSRIMPWIAAQRSLFEDQTMGQPPRGIDPRRIVETIAKRVGDQALVVGDAGTPTPYLSAYWMSQGNRREVILPRGHGAMGYAIPAAIGMALGSSNRPVIALTTDGSFAMACGDLETAVRLAVPVIFVHLSNQSFGWIKTLQHLYLDRQYFGVDVGPVDAVRVAEGFGMPATRVESIEALDEALVRALSQSGPSFIDLDVPDEYEWLPPVSPWQATLAGTGKRPVY